MAGIAENTKPVTANKYGGSNQLKLSVHARIRNSHKFRLYQQPKKH